MLSPLEDLDLEKSSYAVVGMIVLMDFLLEHNENLINNLSFPEKTISQSNLVLGNNAVYQLNVLESESYTYTAGTKFRSLYDVVNNASTAMGKRHVKEVLLSPMIEVGRINDTYDNVQYMIDDDMYVEVEKILSTICDIEKYKRKMNLGILQPYELNDFVSSFESFIDLSVLVKKTKLLKIIPAKKDMSTLDKFCEECHRLFDFTKLKSNILSNIVSSFFNNGIHEDIDKLCESSDNDREFISNVATEFESILNKNKKCITVASTKTEGYYLKTTKKNGDDLLKKIKDKGEILVDKKKIKYDNISSLNLKNNVKIFINNDTKKKGSSSTSDEIAKLTHKYYIETLSKLFETYDNMFAKVIKSITLLDYLKSCAKTAKKYGYVRPTIRNNNNNTSYVSAKELRHPVVERLIDYEYVPHDVGLGKDVKGMMIYGLNSSGKSVLMKAVGLSIIMAQCGMFVPAKDFEYYPYKSLYTRITGNDNIFRGLSSFALEMMELNAILKRTESDTLVIGDEVCRGTEHISGNAIVASTIVHLSKSNSSFIFTTHLHELASLTCIKELGNVKTYHLSVDYDKKTGVLVYDRKLKEGSGEAIYGIIVASNIIKNKSFIDLTNKIKNELTNTYESLISGKTSKYNSDVYVYKCELCDKKDLNGDFKSLETHHINFQKDCKDGIVINKPQIKKNDKANLVVLCQECHDKIHSKKINIDGYIMTSKGKKLKIDK